MLVVTNDECDGCDGRDGQIGDRTCRTRSDRAQEQSLLSGRQLGAVVAALIG
jgi:hypothetical protein